MELKNLFQKKIKIVEEEYQSKEKIKKLILNELKGLNEDFFGKDDISKKWKVEVFENEFLIFNVFGSIIFKEVLQIYDIYKKHGFELYSISYASTKKKNEKGLIFSFRMIENDIP